MATLQSTLIKLVAEQLTVKEEIITLESKFEDLGADSLDVVEIALAIEDHYQIEIPDESASDIDTIGDVLRILEPLVGHQ